ncbi:hypothetical protein AMTR_s00003p00267120 [Amborella trichopoda]|uniref:Uncharacterized protein n=1 Tax=Amborella trichopoda TaxID=13333 RepID=W1P6B6_AMBTC|nr:hypothetical protein AMTR_s00003p00267120 [Amborella trichopoda]
MDTSEGIASKPALGVVNRQFKKPIPIRRSKALRKKKAIEKAILRSDKAKEKKDKDKSKQSRIHNAKVLYD